MADPLSVAASIAGVLALAATVIHRTYKYGSDVKGAPEDIANFLRELKITEGLLDALKTLAENDAQMKSPKLASNGSLASICGKHGALELCKKTLKSVCKDLDSHESLPPQSKRQMVDRLTGRLRWPFRKERTKEIVEQLERQKGAFTLALAIDHSHSLNEFRDGFASFVQQDDERRRDEKLKQLLEWLCPVDIEKHHTNTSIIQQPQTTTWFTDGEELQKLVDGHYKVLWVHGKPGSGKTVLFSSIVNKMRNERPQSSGLAYFYCDYRDPRSRNTITILSGLLKCLARQSKEVADGLAKVFGAKCRPNGQGHDLSLHDLKGALTTASRHFADVLILVDALDEAQDREALISFLHELVITPGNPFKLVVTSRREIDIEAEFGSFPSMELDEDTNKADIHLYVSTQIEQRVRKGTFRIRDTTLKEAIILQLADHSGGLFQWAKSQLDNLFLLRSDEEVQSFLDSVETPLGTVYERTLRRLQMRPAADNQVIKSAFQSLAACLRPPTSAEFLYMIQNDCFSCDATLLKAKLSYENIPNLFQGLLEINPETKALQFSHYSIHEFLTSSQLQDTSLREYSVKEKHAHERLARLCVKALMSHDLEPSTPFYDYAATLWMEHARRAGSSTELDSEIARFLSEGQFSDWRDSSSFANWMTYSEEKKTVPFRNKYDPSKAFLQALILGRESVTAQLIDNGLHHIRDPHGYTVPIVDAVIRGASQELIGKLIESGSDVEDVRFGDQTALTWAVQKEDKELISFLLDKGADVNKIIDKDQVGGSAFNQALLHGSSDIVSFLIMKGADVRQPVSHVGTAIQVAVSERRMDILKVVLQNSGDVRESKGQYGTVLHLAVEQQDIDNEQVVRLLFVHGAEEVINTTLPNKGSALHHAIACNASPRLVNLLLDKGADPNLESAPSTNPLHRAILNNDVITVDTLIRKGATGYSEYGPFKSALECAAFAGHEGVFRRILEFNATKGQTSIEFSRVLQRAIIKGHFTILTRLLQEAGKTQVRDEHGWNPFVCALHVKSDRTLTLLEQGQDLADTVNAGETALSPTKWVLENLPDCYRSLVQSEHSKLQFSGFSDQSSSITDKVALCANHPLPPCSNYYLELTLIQCWSSSQISFGLEESLPKSGHVIFFSGSYSFVIGAIPGQDRLPKVKIGDTIGCGYNWAGSEIYFTLNGKLLETITKMVARDKLFPIVRFSGDQATILTNFGDKPFQYSSCPESEH